MSTTATGGGSPTGSNPAGVASPNTQVDTTYPDRTELRSVPTDENRREDATRGPCRNVAQASLEPPCPSCDGQRVTKAARVPGYSCGDCGAVFQTTGGEVQKPRQRCSVEDCTLWPLCSHPTAGLLEALPEVSEPEPRRCAAPITVAGEAGDLEDECGAVLGKDLHCDVCGGGRCYQHCAGVDHFHGQLITAGTVGRLEWKIVLIAVSRLRGQLYRRTAGLEILATVSGTNVEEVIGQLDHRARELEQLDQVPPPEPARRASRNLNAGLFDMLAASEGKITPQKRTELVVEVIEWLRSCNEQWVQLADKFTMYDGEGLAICRNLHDQQVVELFARLAGAL